MATRNDLEFTQGDDTSFTLQAMREGNPAPMTGKRMELLVKPKAESPDTDALFQLSTVGSAEIAITNEASGLCTATLTDKLEPAGHFWYRAWVADVSDPLLDRETFTYGLWVVNPR